VTEAAGSRIERLYRDEGDRLWRAMLFFSGDREVASDAVAEAFARALRWDAGIRDPRAWVWRTAFRLASAELRRRRRLSPLVERPYELSDAPALLASVLPLLSPRQRACIVLHYYGGYPLKEVAAIVGSTSSAVAVHLHRGRARIRELVGAADED